MRSKRHILVVRGDSGPADLDVSLETMRDELIGWDGLGSMPLLDRLLRPISQTVIHAFECEKRASYERKRLTRQGCLRQTDMWFAGILSNAFFLASFTQYSSNVCLLPKAFSLWMLLRVSSVLLHLH